MDSVGRHRAALDHHDEMRGAEFPHLLSVVGGLSAPFSRNRDDRIGGDGDAERIEYGDLRCHDAILKDP